MSEELFLAFAVGFVDLSWNPGQASIEDNLDLSSAPDYAPRGHQIGYRPKVNTHAAWTPSMFEQYVGDVAVLEPMPLSSVSVKGDANKILWSGLGWDQNQEPIHGIRPSYRCDRTFRECFLVGSGAPRTQPGKSLEE